MSIILKVHVQKPTLVPFSSHLIHRHTLCLSHVKTTKARSDGCTGIYVDRDCLLTYTVSVCLTCPQRRLSWHWYNCVLFTTIHHCIQDLIQKGKWHKFDSAISRLSIYTVHAYVFLLITVLFHMHIPLYTVISYSLNGQATNLQCATDRSCETVYTCNVYATLYFKALHWGLWLRLCRKHFVIIQICFIYIS